MRSKRITVAHYCNEFDGLWILPGSKEFECCICDEPLPKYVDVAISAGFAFALTMVGSLVLALAWYVFKLAAAANAL